MTLPIMTAAQPIINEIDLIASSFSGDLTDLDACEKYLNNSFEALAITGKITTYSILVEDDGRISSGFKIHEFDEFIYKPITLTYDR